MNLKVMNSAQSEDVALDKPVEVYCDENDTTETSDETPSQHFEVDYNDEQEEPQNMISFAQEVECFDIITREEFTDEEHFLSFYTPDEMAEMNDAQNETADRMESGKKAKKSTPYRGLEAWTQRGQHEMNQRIFSCVDSVMDEQDKQWKKGRTNVRKIAKASKSLTKTSKSMALTLAKQDEKEARKIYEEDLEGHAEEEEDELNMPLRVVISRSTIMKSRRKKLGSNRSVCSRDTASVDSDLGLSMHSSDSMDSGFWSLSSASLFDTKAAPLAPKKKRKSKKKSPARTGKEAADTPAKTNASRRKKIKKKAVA